MDQLAQVYMKLGEHGHMRGRDEVKNVVQVLSALISPTIMLPIDIIITHLKRGLQASIG